MVQISLFDITAPPDPISGEAFTLSPLDAFFITPLGAIRTSFLKPLENLIKGFTTTSGFKSINIVQTGLRTNTQKFGADLLRQPIAIIPKTVSGKLSKDARDLHSLKVKLQKAISTEAFEEAAQLRDSIKKIEARLKRKRK